MRKLFAVAMTAALLLPAAGVAAAQVTYVNALVRPSKWRDDPFGDNTRRQPIKVVEKGAETTTPTTSPTATTAPTTTTTAPAVVNANKNDDLASTGASPLGFIALGGLLLVAGAGVFLAARRHRS